MLPEKYLSIYALPLTIPSGFSDEGGVMKNLSKLLTSRFVVLSFNLAFAVGFSTKAYGPVDYVTIPVNSTKDSKAPYNPQDTPRMLQYWDFLCPGVPISRPSSPSSPSSPPSPPSPRIPEGKCRAYDLWKMQIMITPGVAAPPPSHPGQ